MINRIVRMTFDAAQTARFVAVFDASKEYIRNFEGCMHLELWQDAADPCVYYTFSKWQSEEHLNGYRASTLFKQTWAQTKPLFAEKAQAWTINPLQSVTS